MGYDFSTYSFVLITDALPPQSTFTYVLKSLFTVNLFFTYPLQLSPAVNLIESYIFDVKSAPTSSRYWMQNLVRTLIVAFTITLAILVYPNISAFIEIIGAVTCCPLAFTLPALFHYKLMGGSKLNLTIVILTVLLTIFMTTTAIIALVKEMF